MGNSYCYTITINYRNGDTEKRYVSNYTVKDGLLMMHVRFGVDSGTCCIPLDQIKEFKTDR